MSIPLKVIFIESFALNPWSSWPFQAFPAESFSGWDMKRIQHARLAWGFYESIESLDAAIRINLSGTRNIGSNGIVDPNLFTELVTETTYQQYKYGQFLHTYVCPEILWDSQRHLGIPAVGVTSLVLKLLIPYPVPANIIAAIPQNQAVVVFWSQPSNGSTQIVRYTVSTPNVPTVTTNSLSAIVRGLTNGAIYTFTITATDIYGLSSSSTVTAIPRTNPDPPVITGVVNGLGQSIVSWTPPLRDGGGAIVSYTVTSIPGDIVVTTSNLTVTVPGLFSGFTYVFSVVATNSWGLESKPVLSAPSTAFAVPSPPLISIGWP